MSVQPTNSQPAVTPEPRPAADADQASWLARSESAYIQDLRRKSPLIWFLTLFGPPVLSITLVTLAWVFKGWVFAKTLTITALLAFFVFGRFVILGGEDPEFRETAKFFTTVELMMMVVYMDLAVACVLVYHAGFLFKIPFVGVRLLRLVEDGQFMLRTQPWMRRLTLAGLVVFVMAPLPATGSVGGAIFGRLLGLTRRATFLGIALGSVLGSSAVYLGANLVVKHIDRTNPFFALSGIAAVIAIIALLNWRYQRIKKRVMAREAAEAGNSPKPPASRSEAA
ncbi:MAG: small multi-drug export protein [Phycisphaeraceae bacterium]|nr:small multi-drug export protein [Phycisphaeraceae bacterium]